MERLFTQGANPFVLDEIGFVSVAPGGGGKPALVLAGAPDPEPLQMWWIDNDDGGGLPTKGRVIPHLCQATASEVLRLVTAGQEGRATIAGAPLEPGQVAVLVRTHDQARGVQQALAERHIPSVIASSASLFAAAETREMLAFLAAVAEPAHEARVRAALATELVGLSAGELHSLREDERCWEEWLDRFRHYHELWSGRGLVAALRGALAELRVRERLLAYPDGERRVTNVLHLVEVLQAAAEAGHLGPEAVVGWLGRRMADREEADEYQLRLETDERAVQVVTVHRSKGLEYPVVLCPFLWEGLRDDKDDDSVACHDPVDPTRMILDLGSGELPRHRDLARWEALAERVRLAYVALTRASQRCYLAWGAVNKGEDAALGYLLHAPDGVRTAPAGALVDELAASAQAGRERYQEELAAMAEASGGTLRVTETPRPLPAEVVFQPRDGAPVHLERLPPPAAIPRDWGVTSYSALVVGRAEGAEHPDRDEGTAPPATAPAPDLGARPRLDIFAFPRGARAGTCLHAILEELDFPAADGSALEAVVERQLRAHGFDLGWTPAVAANLTGVLTAPLLGDPLLGGETNFRLRDLQGGDRLTELEFHLTLGRVTPEGLARCLADGPDLPPGLATAAASLGFKPLRGLLKGFVDLVFRHWGRYYLLDWKSNHLGDRVEEYGPAALARAMDEHHYHLQYLLYAAALHRYLGHRLPGYRYAEHFGAAVYVFLRGVDPLGRYGIFRARPTEARVEALARYLEQGEGGDA
jgi:exodeoxyribonuclease V beta subunit